MEGTYPVTFGQTRVGKVEVQRQGLYLRFLCRCQISGDVVCRLTVSCGTDRENLGIVVPMDDGFGLETKIPAKRLGEGRPEFTLMPRHETSGSGTFVPIRAEEPFAYIRRLKDAYFERRYGQAGVVIKE